MRHLRHLWIALVLTMTACSSDQNNSKADPGATVPDPKAAADPGAAVPNPKASTDQGTSVAGLFISPEPFAAGTRVTFTVDYRLRFVTADIAGCSDTGSGTKCSLSGQQIKVRMYAKGSTDEEPSIGPRPPDGKFYETPFLQEIAADVPQNVGAGEPHHLVMEPVVMPDAGAKPLYIVVWQVSTFLDPQPNNRQATVTNGLPLSLPRTYKRSAACPRPECLYELLPTP